MIKDVYIPKYNLRFVHVPKTAWTSIRNTLNFEWRTISDIPSSATIFTVIRDPYERFISIYKEVIGKSTNNFPFNIDENDYKSIVDNIRKYSFNSQEQVDFYCESIFSNNSIWDGHQVSHLYAFNDTVYGRGNIKIEDIKCIDFNNIKNEIKKITNNQNLQLNHANKGRDVNHDLFLPHKAKIIDFYREDYEFIKNIKWSYK